MQLRPQSRGRIACGRVASVYTKPKSRPCLSRRSLRPPFAEYEGVLDQLALTDKLQERDRIGGVGELAIAGLSILNRDDRPSRAHIDVASPMRARPSAPAKDGR